MEQKDILKEIKKRNLKTEAEIYFYLRSINGVDVNVLKNIKDIMGKI